MVIMAKVVLLDGFDMLRGIVPVMFIAGPWWLPLT
jgi:hypothetical protein